MNWMHEMADDCADWAVNHWTTCTQNCSQGRTCTCVDQRQGAHAVNTKQPMPAEACTELGSECRKERMGRVSSWERLWLRYGSHALGCFVTGLVVGIDYWSRHV